MKIVLLSSLLLYLVFLLTGIWRLFEKSGRKGWEALIPVYNYYVWLQLIGKPGWWLFLLLIPVVGSIISVVMVIRLLTGFGQTKFHQYLVGCVFHVFYLPYLGHTSRQRFDPAILAERKLRPAPVIGIYLIIILFAVFIRTFFLEAYTIPTTSMAGTLKVGDYLFVNKLAYGPRVPNTPLSLPFTHQAIPHLGIPSYLDWIKLPYWRLGSVDAIQRGDITVFNYPMEGSRPVDQRTPYVKRCVALPGDHFSIKSGSVRVNNTLSEEPADLQFPYYVTTRGYPLSDNTLIRLGIREGGKLPKEGLYYYLVSEGIAGQLKTIPDVLAIEKQIMPETRLMSELFPMSGMKWNLDHYGPITVPSKGATVQLTSGNIRLYARIIRDYEGNTLDISGDEISINGKAAHAYTFRQNYYFMLGDNRHNAADSRYWGFVPEDHIIGKVWMIWMSYDVDASLSEKIRWDRIFEVVE